MRWMQHASEGDSLFAQKMSSEPNTKSDVSEIIAENFGANANYVETLLARFRSDPALVDESWRAYFAELLGAGSITGSDGGAVSRSKTADGGAAAVTAQRDGTKAAAAPARAKTKVSEPPALAGGPELRTEAVPIRGPALKIVENLEASLSVPTATSQRRIPVKLLDENRRIVNRYLGDNDGRKASFTHLIAWA